MKKINRVGFEPSLVLNLSLIDIIYLFIYLYLKRTAHLAINASLPCVPLKHIYIYTQVKHMIKHRICQV